MSSSDRGHESRRKREKYGWKSVGNNYDLKFTGQIIEAALLFST